MIDREARSAMSEAVQAFLDQKIGSDKFDEMISEIARKSQDQSVGAIRDALWSFYSDTEDHNCVASKQQWGLLNRLRLILASNGEVEWYRTGPRWNIYRTISALCLAGFGTVALYAGFGTIFVTYWIFSGFLTCAVLWVWNRNDRKAWEPEVPLFPFPSIGAILSTRRQVPDFARKRYPKPVAREAKWHARFDEMMVFLRLPLWVTMAPLALLFLSLSIRRQEMRLKSPAASP